MNTYYLIDESGDLNEIKGRKSENIFIVGCVVVGNIELIEGEIKKLWRSLPKKREFHRHKNSNFKRKTFHACEDHIDIRNEFIKFMGKTPFRYYATFIDKNKIQLDNSLYFSMLEFLLKGRVKKKMRINHNIYIEEGSYLTEEKLKILEESISNEIKTGDTLNLELKSKDLHSLSLVDYMNSIFKQFLIGTEGKYHPFMEENYKTMRDKIGLIHFYNQGKFISTRKNQEDFDLPHLFN